MRHLAEVAPAQVVASSQSLSVHATVSRCLLSGSIIRLIKIRGYVLIQVTEMVLTRTNKKNGTLEKHNHADVPCKRIPCRTRMSENEITDINPQLLFAAPHVTCGACVVYKSKTSW